MDCCFIASDCYSVYCVVVLESIFKWWKNILGSLLKSQVESSAAGASLIHPAEGFKIQTIKFESQLICLPSEVGVYRFSVCIFKDSFCSYRYSREFYSATTRLERIIRKQKYPLEKYTVTTEDGYINSMYRIPHGRTLSDNTKPRSPVILFHGMSGSCAAFVNQSVLAYYLADRGFDVWLPNNRGTTFSRKHVNFNAYKDRDKYWNFSWHEIGIYDTPAFIDRILLVTGFDKLYFIGHSQGSTVFAAFLSERPQYNDKIALCCLLGPPIIFESGISFRLTLVSKLIMPLLEGIHHYFKFPIYEMPFVPLSRWLGKYAKPDTFLNKVYLSIFFLVTGNPDLEQISEMNFREFSLTTPNSFSIMQSYHYLQIIRSARFAKYDHGPEKNMEVYGCIKPPLYDLSKIHAPVALFNSKNDMYYNPKDVDKLERMLGNVVYKHLVDCELFNHADFLFAKDSVNLLYYHLVELMKLYTPEKS